MEAPPSRSRTRASWIGNAAARLARFGTEPEDDEEIRHEKSLLVLLAVLILPVSVAWGTIYLALGSWVGVLPFIYLAVSIGSLVLFARTGSFRLLLVIQLLDILLMTAAGQMFVGGFLPSGGVGLWGILAPLGALVFLEVRREIRWFVVFVVLFLLTGIAGEVLFREADFPIWFTSTMLALNVIGAGTVAFTLLASFADQRNAALAALRVEQEKSESLLRNILPRSIAERLKAASETIADHFDSASILFADVVDFTPLAQQLAPAEVVGILDRLFSHFDTLVERHGLEKIKTIGDCYMAAAGVPDQSPDHARRAALLALDIREAVATSAVGDGVAVEMRIGINSGPVIAGVIGSKRFLYDLWGRRREHGEPDGVTEHTRRDPDHPRHVRAAEGRIRLQATGNDPGQRQGPDGDLVPGWTAVGRRPSGPGRQLAGGGSSIRVARRGSGADPSSRIPEPRLRRDRPGSAVSWHRALGPRVSDRRLARTSGSNSRTPPTTTHRKEQNRGSSRACPPSHQLL